MGVQPLRCQNIVGTLHVRLPSSSVEIYLILKGFIFFKSFIFAAVALFCLIKLKLGSKTAST